MKVTTGAGEGKDDTCDHGLYGQKLESRSVCQKRKVTREEMSNQQSAAIRSTSSTKQHKLVCQLPTNTRPLALDRRTTTATESGTTATTKHTILLSTYHHLRVAQLNNRRNLHNTTLEAPGAQPLAMLLLPPPRLVMRALQQFVDPFFPHLFLQVNKADKAHNGGYLTQGPTLVLIIVVFECNPTRPPGRPALHPSLPRWHIRLYPRAWYRSAS